MPGIYFPVGSVTLSVKNHLSTSSRDLPLEKEIAWSTKSSLVDGAVKRLEARSFRESSKRLLVVLSYSSIGRYLPTITGTKR